MAASKRALAAGAAGALLVPFSPFVAPALADHVDVRPVTFACPADQVSSGLFDDVPAGSPFALNINCIADYGVANGFPDGEYKASRLVTREQMAQFVFRVGELAGVVFDTETDPGFDDIAGPGDTSSAEAQDAIFGLANAGIVQGFDDGDFRPGGLVLRDQMAAFLLRLQQEIGVTGFSSTTDFFDDDESSTFEADINAIASEGVTAGDGTGDRRYGPGSAVDRAQMAIFLTRKLDILVAQGFVDTVYSTISVTPDGAAIRDARPNPDTDPADDRLYTATGLVPGTEYRVNLVLTANITGRGQDARFAEDGSTGLVATGTRTADITQVNGVAATNNTGRGTPFTAPTNTGTAVGIATSQGSLTFVVDGDLGGEAVVPVVYVNGGGNGDRTPAQGGASPRLEIDDEGRPTEPFDTGGTLTFTVPAAAATTRPELVGTEFVETRVVPGQLPPLTPDTQESDVRFTFDEPVTVEGAAGLFHLVDQGGATRFDGATVVSAEDDATSVIVTFDGVGPAELATLTLATVDAAGVADLGGSDNPIGDEDFAGPPPQAPPAGITAGPDLLSATGFRAVDMTTEVDFTFDEEAFVGGETGFLLVRTDGTVLVSSAAVEGEGLVTATFDEVVTAAQVARAVVVAETVTDTAPVPVFGTVQGDPNPTQAVDVSAGGTTVEPDLVSAVFDLTAGTATYTFDTDVTAPTAGGFRAYGVDGSEVVATAAEPVSGNARQIRATFAEGVLDDAVGASVAGGSVESTSTPALDNEVDEVGVQQPDPAAPVPGITDAPDLTGVELAAAGTATFTFDENVDSPVAGELRLYLADGVELVCTAAAPATSRNAVVCTAFEVAGTMATATAVQVQSAVLATVDDGAVNASGGGPDNPEGAVLTTGTTGTRRE